MSLELTSFVISYSCGYDALNVKYIYSLFCAIIANPLGSEVKLRHLIPVLDIEIHFSLLHCLVERGSSDRRMPDSQSREPGFFESPLLPFLSFGIFVLFTPPKSSQLYK